MLFVACRLLLALAAATPQWRPLYHFTPAANFMNDPNGLVWHAGEYHLFYQHNPFGNEWGHMSWGHAVSPDMVRWRHLPVALREENGTMIFSGSAVVDRGNTAGFGRGAMVAIYAGQSRAGQTQNIAYSTDNGRTWTKYAGNPVIDLHMKDFRDPKVFWHEPSRKWVMVTVLAADRKVRFFGSRDLKNWTALSDFGPAGATGGVWECPDLFELPIEGEPGQTRWVLDVDINPGAVAGGSGGQYFVGRFDGEKFTGENAPETTLWADWGKDFYASMSFDLPPADKRRIWMGWMSNWEYANQEPTSPWRCQQSIPRVLGLRRTPQGLRLIQAPVEELRTLRREPFRLQDTALAAAKPLPRGNSLEILAEIDSGSAREFGLRLRKGPGEQTVLGVRREPGEVFLDRSRSGAISFAKTFAGRHAAPLRVGRTVQLHAFIDCSSVEVFVNGGETVISDRIFPSAASNGLEAYSEGGDARFVRLEVWKLAPAGIGATSSRR